MTTASKNERHSQGTKSKDSEHAKDLSALSPQAEEKEMDSSEVSESVNMLAAKPPAEADAEPYRTRWLYFMIFVYYACGGRFMSLYYLAEGLDESEVGAVFAVGGISGQLVSTFVGVWADRLTLRFPAARHWCLGVLAIVGAAAFTLQAVHIPHLSRFGTMLLCRVITDGCRTSTMIMADAITLDGLQDRKLFGQERLYGAVSWAITHIFLGLLLDAYGRIVQHIFIVIAACLVVVVLLAIGVPSSAPGHTHQQSSPAKKNAPGLAALSDRNALCTLMRSYFTSRQMLGFFVYAVTLGFGMTIVENLIFMYFRELDASYFLCGVSVVVTVVFEIPLFARSKALLEQLGVAALLTIAGLCYSLRVVGYTLCPGGWFVLLFEPMHGVTIATWSTASVEFVASLTPPEFTATGQAILNLVKSGVGSTAGNSIGGAIIGMYSERACYRVSAVIVMVGLFIYRMALRDAPNSAIPVGEVEPEHEEEQGRIPPLTLGHEQREDACHS